MTSTGVLSAMTLDAIQAEATRAHLSHGEHSMLGPDFSGSRLAILVEEVGEVARELTRDGLRRDELARELVQVAAMAASWAEFLRGGGPA